VKAYGHQLAESGITFFVAKPLASQCGKKFSQPLTEKLFLLQGKNAQIRNRLLFWLDKIDLSVNVVAEFDDSALMKNFGQAGYGVFVGPTLIEETIVSQYKIKIIGRTNEIKEYYFAISLERRIKHPAVIEIINAIRA